MIRNTVAVAQRELKSYFVSPVAWIITAVFMFIWAFLFTAILGGSREASLNGLLSNFSVTFLFAAPLLTMRLIAEEARSGTLELMMTQPIREVELVLGKYLGATIFLLFMIAVTLYFPAVLLKFGNPDKGPMVSGYLGVVLQGMAFLAIGLVASSLTQNQIIAVAVSFVTLLGLWLADLFTRSVPGPVGQAFQYMSITQRFQDLPKGVIDTKDILYFITVIVACLFISTQILSARRWR